MSQGEIKKEIRPIVKYRVELQKRLEINKSYKERRNRANALRILSYGLFGQKRFQNLYVGCSLNCFYWALQIASFLHQRVAGLAMIINFDQVSVTEYYENTTELGQSFAVKKYTKILIKLTKNPTEEDKKQPGYNPGFKSQDIKDQLKQVIGKREGGQAKRENGGRGPRRTENRRYRDDRGERKADRGDRKTETGYKRQERGDRRQDRGERKEGERKQDRGDRKQDRGERRTDRVEKRDYQERRNRGDRQERREKDEYREKPYQKREQQRDRPRRQQREERSYRPQRQQARERPQAQQKPKYGDDRDQRRVYNESQNQQRGERYERGEKKTRGGNNRAQVGQNREKRYEPKREQRASQRVDRQGRGDRKPKNSRYSDDSD